jgi:putative peptide zinc metalloprotease protein
MLAAQDQHAAPRLLDDIAVWPFYQRGPSAEDTYIVGSVTADRYLTVPESKLPAIRAFLQRLDGTRTLGEVSDSLTADFGIRIDVDALYRRFQAAGLVAGGAETPAGDIEQMSATAVRIPIGRLLRLLSRLSLFGKASTGVGIALIVTALVCLALDSSFRVLAASPVLANGAVFWTTGLFAGTTLFSVVVHELSHCFAAACCGIQSGSLRLQLYLGVFPIAGLKFAGLYTLPVRGRLAVWSAGLFANASLAAAALLAMRTWSPASTLLAALLTVNWLMIVLNLLPLLPTDGYFLLTTLAKDANVRTRAWSFLRNPFRSTRSHGSWVVLVYLSGTLFLLVSTLWNHVWRVLDLGDRLPFWQSLLSLFLVMTFVAMIWRTLQRSRNE